MPEPVNTKPFNPEHATKAAAILAFRTLDDGEISAIYNTVTANWPLRAGVKGFEKIKSLLTEAGGTKFHPLVVEALDQEIGSRPAFKALADGQG